MNSEKVKIYFLGSGPIAIPVLRALREAPHLELLGVGTQPDRPAGRKCKLLPTPLGGAAAELCIEPDKVENVNSPEFIAKLRALAPDIVLVVSFGQLLRAELLSLPRCGCVNIHASLLPRYRGASPIFQALRNMDPASGVCFMRMERGLDTGPVYRTIEVPLFGCEYADKLEQELGRIAGDVCNETLSGIAAGNVLAVPQDHAAAVLCTKVKKSEGQIDWNAPAREIDALVRAATPWPGAFFTLACSRGEFIVTVRKSRVVAGSGGIPGEVVQADKHGFVVGCGEGVLEIVELSVPGKRSMTGAEFINGIRGEKPLILLDSPQITT